MIGHSDAMRITADRVQDVARAYQGRLGVDHPVFGVELRPQLLDVLRRAQGWKALHAERGGGGASLEERLTELAAQDRAQGPHRKAEARISLNPACTVSGQRPSCHDAVDM